MPYTCSTFLYGFFFWSQQAFSLAKITKVRAWKSPDKTRVVFEITNKAKYSVFQLQRKYFFLTQNCSGIL